MDREHFEKWAMLESSYPLDFSYNGYNTFMWFSCPFWSLEDACKVNIFKEYENFKN
jgi:hypothetical protein